MEYGDGVGEGLEGLVGGVDESEGSEGGLRGVVC